jgi:VanZ family protein
MIAVMKKVAVVRGVAWLLFVAVIALTVIPPGLRPISGLPHAAEHLIIFLLLGASFALGYPHHAYSLCFLGIIFVAALEITQIFIPGRHARLSDFIVDAASTCAGIAVTALLARAADRKPP